MSKNPLSFSGLDSVGVASSREKYGSNRLTVRKSKSFFRKYIESFNDPIIKILLFSVVLNFIFVLRDGDWYETAGIALAVFISTFVSTVSEYGSEMAFKKLNKLSGDHTVCVIRNNTAAEIHIDELVCFDVIHLSAGEMVPADCVVISGSLTCDQSTLTGESRDKQKRPVGRIENINNIDWRLESENQIFRGSLITSGDAKALVMRVGDSTFYGSMAMEMQSEARESPLKLRLAKLASALSKIGYIAAALVCASDIIHSFAIAGSISSLSTPDIIQNLLHALTIGITIVVVSVPEGLPMMITVVLSSNMFRMMRDKVMVRKLVGIETAGSMNILFTDKTGTITKGNTSVTSFVTAYGDEYTQSRQMPTKIRATAEISAFFNTASSLDKTKIFGGNSTDRAMLAFALPKTLSPDDYTRTAYVPFDSMYKFSAATVVSSGGKKTTYIKGAPELIIDKCTQYMTQDGTSDNFTDRSKIHAKIKKLTMQSARIIAIAISDTEVARSDDFENLTFIGIAIIRDSLRREAKPAITKLTKAGIQTVMITGDNKNTAYAVAAECGIISKKRSGIYTGDELNKMTDAEIKNILPSLAVIARALPSDKSRLVRIAQECDFVVGMTGDGINDAPALKKADVGFAMGSGTDVAKEAGDIVILDNNISSIARAVLYGRTIFKSIRKFIIFQLTMNMCAVGVSIIGTFIGIDTPVTVMQMLWINIIMDTLAGLAFAGEPPLEVYMNEPPKKRSEPVLNRYMACQIISMGIYTISLCTFFLASNRIRSLFRTAPDGIYFLTAFFALFVFCGIFNSFNSRTTSANPIAHLAKNPAFVVIMLAVSIVQILLVKYSFPIFRTAALTFDEFKTAIIMAASVIPANMAIKLILGLVRKRR